MDRREEFVDLSALALLLPEFGWFHTLQIDAKGHPISRVARMVNADV
jgi:hypothetical protein